MVYILIGINIKIWLYIFKIFDVVIIYICGYGVWIM